MSFKPVFVMTDGERATNAQRFATEEEAYASAAARFMVWTMPSAFDTEESADPVNYRWSAEDGDISLASAQRETV